jgi:endoribonuclease Dicer
MLQLELTLDCRVFGVSEERRQEIIHLPNNPNETIVLYDSVAQKVSQTPLYQKLLKLDPSKKHWRRFFRAADIAFSKLGNCASDLVWRLALKEIEAKIPTWQEDDDPDSIHGIQIRMRDTVRNWTFTMPNLNPSAPGFNVTHKFLRLVQVLETCENYGENFRALIFGTYDIIFITNASDDTSPAPFDRLCAGGNAEDGQ